MQLRPRQEVFVERGIAALKEHGRTIGQAPTGFGKTVVASSIAASIKGPVLWVQHRDELIEQNRRTFRQMNPSVFTSLYTAGAKHFGKGHTFGMVQTLARNLTKIPELAGIVIDEAHHAAAGSYLQVIDAAVKRNPNLKILGVTATPARGDRKSLKGVFRHCFDQVQLVELIKTGALVRPRTLVVDVGVREQLQGVKRLASEFDMSEVEAIMDKQAVTAEIIKHWREQAGDRRTVVFCATVAHAQHVAEMFREDGVAAACVHGDLPSSERERILADLDCGRLQVVTNVAVLTEGWDCQPVSCVLLLRPSSFKSTMIQMIGRGLRKLEPERYPGVRKDDCVVIDFGTSVLMHGSLEQDGQEGLEGQGVKVCPGCDSEVPAQCNECPICGHAFPRVAAEAPTKKCPDCGEKVPVSSKLCPYCQHSFAHEAGALEGFVLTEVDLLHQSPYQWERLFDGLVMVANGIEAWAAIVCYAGRWVSVGGDKEKGMRLLADNDDRLMALATADDFLREKGDKSTAKKSKQWLGLPPTDKQLQMLGMGPMQAIGMTRYQAACLLTWRFNERGIRRKLEIAQAKQTKAA